MPVSREKRCDVFLHRKTPERVFQPWPDLDIVRLAAQEGVFTLWRIIKPVHIDGGKWKFDATLKDVTPLDQLLVKKLSELKVNEQPYLYRISFPRKASVEIYDYLKQIDHTAAKLFPGYVIAAD